MSYSKTPAIRQDIIFVVNVILCIFLLLALVSYHPNDPAFYQKVDGYLIHNFEGYVGAQVAGLFFYYLGYGAFLMPILCLWGARKSLKGEFGYAWHVFFGFLILLIGTLGMMSLHMYQDSLLPSGVGGYIGDAIAWLLTDWANVVGASLILSSLVLIGLTLFCEMTWSEVLRFPTIKISRPVVAEPIPVEKKKKVTSNPVMSKLKKKEEKPAISPNLLNEASKKVMMATPQEKEAFSQQIEERLKDFNVDAHVVGVIEGPVVTRYEIALAAGTKVSRISTLAKDLARSLSVTAVRIVEVIPGKAVIGLEFPNKNRQTVVLKEIIDTPQFKNAKSPLTLALGKGISGETICADLAKMPHLLVAGTTGAGKSVGLNAMLLSMLYKSSPEQLKLILIDPKMLELSAYSDIPHLLTPVVTNMDEAAGTLRWCVAEMERRYQLMASLGVRNIAGYNEKVKKQSQTRGLLEEAVMHANEGDTTFYETLPYIVVVADEFADMIMVVGKKVEQLIARLAQKARAAGIHIILATQRPSVDVITGLIKANIPCRIAFQVSSKIDSRTILDQQGAETLLGYGDMLYLPSGTGLPTRVHGAYVSDEEVHQVVSEIRKQGKPNYLTDIADKIEVASEEQEQQEEDALYQDACAEVIRTKKVSISSVQRKFRIGYNRAANLVEAMERNGIVSAPEHNGQRQVLKAENND